MLGRKIYLTAKETAKELGISNTTFFKYIEKGNGRGFCCPVHQMGPGCRKYYVIDEVKTWIDAVNSKVVN